MKAAFAHLLIATLARLPLSLNRGIGTVAGWLMWATRQRARRFSEINLSLAYPDMPVDERERLVRRSLIETGRATTEAAWLWQRPIEDILRRLHNSDMRERIAETRARGRGTLLVTPHTGAWEATLLMATERQYAIPYFYRPPRDSAYEQILINGRERMGGTALKLDAGGIRRAIKLLRAGDVVGILPDQEPDRTGGVFAPFFGVPALTMTLISRLVRSSGAEVLFVMAERTPEGWRDHALPPAGDIASEDPVAAATAVNASVENCVAIAPEQYLWSYRRFRELPEGGRRPY